MPTSISARLTEAAYVSGLTEILQDYCSVLDAEGEFTGLCWLDAKPVAAAICFDVCNRDDAADFLRATGRATSLPARTACRGTTATASRGALTIADALRDLRIRCDGHR
jgi:hypothetical protein